MCQACATPNQGDERAAAPPNCQAEALTKEPQEEAGRPHCVALFPFITTIGDSQRVRFLRGVDADFSKYSGEEEHIVFHFDSVEDLISFGWQT